jgi:hypothetical protein
MSKVVITGHTKGIGLEFWKHFAKLGWHTVGFNTSTGLANIVKQATNCDLFINNAYADGKQIDLLNELHPLVEKMIVCGSVAAFSPDTNMQAYSNHKSELATRVKELQETGTTILMLHLSAKGYNDPTALLALIDVWLKHPCITDVSFDTTGEPNG